VLVHIDQAEGEKAAAELGDAARFVPADVTEETALAAALDVAVARGPLRAVVCPRPASRSRRRPPRPTPAMSGDLAKLAAGGLGRGVDAVAMAGEQVG